MTREKLVQIIIPFLSAIVAGVIIFLIMNSRLNQQKMLTEQALSELNQTRSMWGAQVTAYTVNSSVTAGERITQDTITNLTLPSSAMSDMYVTDVSSILGKYYKIPITQGTILTYDMVMDYELEPSMRDYDLTFTSWTVGLHAGDFIDITLTLPYGDQYKVLTKKRVEEINGSTLKVYLTEADIETYKGAMVDYYLNSAYGATITADRYVEPGLQAEAVPYYAVPDNIQTLMAKDPNIEDKASAAATASWRTSIEEALTMFRDEADTVDSDAQILAQGRSEHYASVTEAREEVSDAEEKNGQGDEQLNNDFWGDTEQPPTSTPETGPTEVDVDMPEAPIESGGEATNDN